MNKLIKCLKITEKDILGVAEMKLNEHNGPVYALAMLNNGDLVSGSMDNTVKTWNMNNGIVKETLIGHSFWLVSAKSMLIWE